MKTCIVTRPSVEEERVFFDVINEEVRVLAIVAKEDADAWLRAYGDEDSLCPDGDRDSRVLRYESDDGSEVLDTDDHDFREPPVPVIQP